MQNLDREPVRPAGYDLQLEAEDAELDAWACALHAFELSFRPVAGRLVADIRTEQEERLRRAAPPDHGVIRVADVSIGPPGRAIPVREYRPPCARVDLAVVYFHGGGWVLGSPESFDRQCLEIAEQFGARVLSVDYRLAPEYPFPAAVDDALTVIAGLRDKTGSRCVLAGESAGATLALTSALRLRDSGDDAVCGLALWYPIVVPLIGQTVPALETPLLRAADLTWFWAQYLGDGLRSSGYAAPGLAPDLFGLPPTFVVLAGRDPSRPDAERFVSDLRRALVPAMAVFCGGLPHAFRALSGAVGRETVRLAAAWACPPPRSPSRSDIV